MVLTAQAGLVWQYEDLLVVCASKRLIVALSEVYDFVQQRGDPSLVFPGGACPTVGISGYLLGGGFSFISRAFGMGWEQECLLFLSHSRACAG
jgi:hypothetical protein